MRIVTIFFLIFAAICSADEVDELIDKGLLSEAYQYLIDNYKNSPDPQADLFVKGLTEESGENSAAYFKDLINKLTEDSNLADWARLYLGKYYLTQKLYLTARKQFESVSMESAFKDEAEYLAAKCLLLAEETNLAADSFKAIVDRHETSEPEHQKDDQNNYYGWSILGLADSWLAEHNYQKAEEFYKKLLDSQFEDDILAPALLGLSELYQKLQKWDESQRYIDIYNDRYQSNLTLNQQDTDNKKTARDYNEPPDEKDQSTALKGYYIQVGSFSNLNNALRHSSLYKNSGYKTTMENYIEGGKEFHRVLIGSYNSKQQAEFVKNRLERAAGERYLVLKR